ncbi:MULTISPECIES: chloride channel protein [unclassified Devosia]|uniref:chloride channel protein n=1 Tax=unclassified Devosia TaxID=196773 RepID=UPI0020BE8D79|nr:MULTISPECIES: chloride channel protein [unclassified Devosia]
MSEPEAQQAEIDKAPDSAPDQAVPENAGAQGQPGWSASQLGKGLRWLQHRLTAEGMSAWMGSLIRRRETGLVVLAVVIGALAGLVVLVLRELAYGMQSILFQLSPGERLSALPALAFDLAFVPAIGGLLLGLLGLLLRRRKSRYVDLVEANALHGGKLSMTDSLIITAQTLISNGFGASVGLEAAYTQMGGATASKLGDFFHLRRGDLRKLVGCGAGAAIAAAFGAPLTGAFYAFELIIGTYSISTLAPVIAACISAVLVTSVFGQGHTVVSISQALSFGVPQVLLIVVSGVAAGGLGILLMRLVGVVERSFSKSHVPSWCRPAVGGLIVGGLAMISPAVLSAGHGALERAFASPPLPIGVAVSLLVLKVLASAVSLGSGFRGGLFFASLFLGALLGQVYFWLAQAISPGLFPDPSIPMLVGMAGLAAAVVGGPLTMAFLALEISGSLPLTIAVLVAAVTSSMLVRETFGYSFTTWRFHLRGETIRSAHDVGWMRNLTVGKMMRRDVKMVPQTMTLKEFRRAYPLGSANRVIATRDDGRYVGLIDVADAYAPDGLDEAGTVSQILRQTDVMLHPALQALDAGALFEKHNAEAIVVVSDLGDPKVIGILTEAHLLRRYSNELEKARADLAQ